MKILLFKKSMLRISSKLLPLVFVCFALIASCTQTEPIDSEGNPKNCFSKSSLEDTPWVKKQLQSFQRPKSGHLVVTVYLYQEKHFIVFANPSLSSPVSYMFDCAGTKFGDLNLGTYNQFYDQAKLIEVLLEENY